MWLKNNVYLENISIETSKTDKEKEDGTPHHHQNPQNIPELQEKYKICHMHIRRIPGEKEKGMEAICEAIMTENFSQVNDTKLQAQEGQRTCKQEESKLKYLKCEREKKKKNY